jgi:hypothetical protein
MLFSGRVWCLQQPASNRDLPVGLRKQVFCFLGKIADGGLDTTCLENSYVETQRNPSKQ